MSKRPVVYLYVLPVVIAIRQVIYRPVQLLPYMPGGPVRWLWLIRLTVWADWPLRTFLLNVTED